jgi:hypothetical protein
MQFGGFMRISYKRLLAGFFVLAFYLILFQLPGMADSSHGGTRATGLKHKKQSSKQATATPMMPMPLVVPLFIQDLHFSSTLVMVNAAPRSRQGPPSAIQPELGDGPEL